MYKMKPLEPHYCLSTPCLIFFVKFIFVAIEYTILYSETQQKFFHKLKKIKEAVEFSISEHPFKLQLYNWGENPTWIDFIIHILLHHPLSTLSA